MPNKTIAFFGVIFYRICKLVENSTDYRFKLYIDKSDLKLIENEIDKNYPWLDVTKSYKKISNFSPNKFLNSIETKFDIIFYSDDSLLYSYSTKVKTKYFLPIGYDLTQLPFHNMNDIKPYFIGKQMRRMLTSYLQRNRLQKMTDIICSEFEPFQESLKKLQIKKNYSQEFLPLPINYKSFEIFRHNLPHMSRPENLNKFIIFYPNRIIFNNSKNILTGQTKNTGMFINSLHILVNKYNFKNVTAIFIENKGSPETLKAKKLIYQLGLQSYCKWIYPKINQSRLSTNRMAELYASSHAIIGDLGSNWFGQTSIESAFFGKPILAKCDSQFLIRNFGFSPFVEVKNEIELAQKIYYLIRDREFYASMCANSYNWYQTFFSEKKLGYFYKNLFDNLINR